MSKLFVLAASVADGASDVVEESKVTLIEALGLSGLGFALVFSVLIILMAFIAIMSALLRAGQKPAVKETAAPAAPVAAPAPQPVAAAPVVTPAPAVYSGEADMFVTLDGKRHAVSVVEKLPRFTVTVNGKSHGVDVEKIEEE